MNKRMKIILVTLLLWFLQGCIFINAEPRNKDVIEGDYKVGYVLSLQDNPIVIGSLSLADGKYIFTQQDGVDIPENLFNRFFFVANIEGQYEVIYDFAYQASQNIIDVAGRGYIARINFFTEDSISNSNFELSQTFLILYSEKSYSLLLTSPVSEIELWHIVKYLE